MQRIEETYAADGALMVRLTSDDPDSPIYDPEPPTIERIAALDDEVEAIMAESGAMVTDPTGFGA